MVILTVIAFVLMLIYIKIPASITLNDIQKTKGKARQELIKKIPYTNVWSGDVEVSGNVDVSGSTVTLDN